MSCEDAFVFVFAGLAIEILARRNVTPTDQTVMYSRLGDMATAGTQPPCSLAIDRLSMERVISR